MALAASFDLDLDLVAFQHVVALYQGREQSWMGYHGNQGCLATEMSVSSVVSLTRMTDLAGDLRSLGMGRLMEGVERTLTAVFGDLDLD